VRERAQVSWLELSVYEIQLRNQRVSSWTMFRNFFGWTAYAPRQGDLKRMQRAVEEFCASLEQFGQSLLKLLARR
jgi:hypothetical protein